MQLSLAALGSFTGRGVRVAILDSGVHAAHPHVQFVSGGIGIDAAGRIHDDFVDRLGHGTAVTAAIREKAPQADLYIVKVFDRELATTGDALVAGIRHARAAAARIANLSLGTTNAQHEAALQQEIESSAVSGMFIVAAAAQGGMRWLPGSLPGVIAVEMDDRLARDVCEIEIAGSAVMMKACGYPRPIPGVAPERNLHGISFAVANATGTLARLLERAGPDASIQRAIAALT